MPEPARGQGERLLLPATEQGFPWKECVSQSSTREFSLGSLCQRLLSEIRALVFLYLFILLTVENCCAFL